MSSISQSLLVKGRIDEGLLYAPVALPSRAVGNSDFAARVRLGAVTVSLSLLSTVRPGQSLHVQQRGLSWETNTSGRYQYSSGHCCERKPHRSFGEPI